MFETFALKAGGLLIAGAASIAVGFAAGEAWEHGSPWGLAAQRDKLKASIPALVAKGRQDGADAQAAADKLAFAKWSADLAACRAGRAADADAASQDLARASTFASTQASAAYRLGRSTCGAKTDATPLPGAPPADPGGVRDPGADFRTLFGAGAYTPAGANPVPGGR